MPSPGQVVLLNLTLELLLLALSLYRLLYSACSHAPRATGLSQRLSCPAAAVRSSPWLLLLLLCPLARSRRPHTPSNPQ